MSNNQEMPKLQAYKVNLSKGDAMKCDTDELPQIILAVKTGSPCKIRSGLFNPSYYVSITEDRERITEIERENSRIRQGNEQNRLYGEGKNYKKYKNLIPIKDIFEGINLKAGSQIQKPSKENKLIDIQIGENKSESGRYKQAGH